MEGKCSKEERLQLVCIGLLLASRQQLEAVEPTSFMDEGLASLVGMLKRNGETGKSAAEHFVRSLGVEQINGTIADSIREQCAIDAEFNRTLKRHRKRSFYTGSKRGYLEQEK